MPVSTLFDIPGFPHGLPSTRPDSPRQQKYTPYAFMPAHAEPAASAPMSSLSRPDVSPSLAALDCLEEGVLLLGEHGQVLFANWAALQLLNKDQVLTLLARHGADWLRAHGAQNQARLHRGIEAMLAADRSSDQQVACGLRLASPSSRDSLILRLQALPGPDIRIIAFLTDPSRRLHLDEALLAQLYDATPAEVRLAQELLDGSSLPAISEHLGLSHNTLKKQLQSLFLKTGTCRQTQLVRLLARLTR